MSKRVDIENIEAMRRREGIDDVELREDIRALRVGDFVKLTLLSSAAATGETVLVRLTRVRGAEFRGKLVARPACAGLADLEAGEPLAFKAEHIHSLPKGRPANAK